MHLALTPKYIGRCVLGLHINGVMPDPRVNIQTLARLHVECGKVFRSDSVAKRRRQIRNKGAVLRIEQLSTIGVIVRVPDVNLV